MSDPGGPTQVRFPSRNPARSDDIIELNVKTHSADTIMNKRLSPVPVYGLYLNKT